MRTWFSKLIILPALFFMLLPLQAMAIELIIPDLDGSPFDKIQVPVTVNGFDAVAGVELHIAYDDGNLTIDSVIAPYLPGSTINIGIPGQVHVVWDSNNAVTIADGNAVIMMFFSIKPNAAGTSDFNFFGHIELTNQAGVPYGISWSSGTVTVTPLDAENGFSPLPGQFALMQNYPNPFNPSTTIAYYLDKASDLQLQVFNVAGQIVDQKDLGRSNPGWHSFTYSGGHLSSGIYTYRLLGDGISQSRQMVLVK